jgi:hypothetical protein
MGALLDTPLVLFLVAFAFTRSLKLGQALIDHFLIGLVSWDAFSAADAEALVLAAQRGGEAGRDAALAELRAKKTRVWRCALTGRLPMTQPWFAGLFRQALDWFYAELLSLCSVVALFCMAHALVGTFECLRGGPPSLHLCLVAGSALVAALAGLAAPAAQMGWRALQNQLAASFGLLAAVLAGSGFAVLHAGSAEAPSVDRPLRRGEAPLLDLGAPLGAALRGRGAALAAGAAVALLVFLCGALFVGPALHVAKYYAESVIAARASARPRLARAALRLWWYAPLFAAAAWVRPFGADFFVPADAVACAAGDVARDCRASLPGVAGGDAWAALLPVALARWALPAALAPPPLPPGLWLGETAFLRLRVAAVLLFVAAHLRAVQGTVQAVKDSYWRRAALAVARATRPGAPLAAPGAPPAEPLRALLRAVEQQRIRAALAPMLTMQVAAVPVAFGALAFLLVRLGGLGGVGLCSALHGATGGALRLPGGGGAPPAGGGGAGTIGALFSALAAQLLPPAAAGQLQSARDSVLGAAAAPALWRPMLSYALFALLLTYAALLELGLVYWRAFGGPDEEGADDEEGGAAKKGGKGGKQGKPAPAPAGAAEEEDEDVPSILTQSASSSKKER